MINMKGQFGGLKCARQRLIECCSNTSNGNEANACPQLGIARLLQSSEALLQHDPGSQQLGGHLMLLPPLFQARAVPPQCSRCQL